MSARTLEQVEAWRLEVLIEAGYPVAIADQLAADDDVDLHVAVDLLKSGCSPQRALEILL